MEKYGRGELGEVIVGINGITKVVKDGKRLKFIVLVIVGNRKDLVGVGYGKAKEVPNVVRKTVDDISKDIIEVKAKGSTIAHDAEARYSTNRILLKPTNGGTGTVVGDSIRSIVELAGIENILTRPLGSSNSASVVRATTETLIVLKG